MSAKKARKKTDPSHGAVWLLVWLAVALAHAVLLGTRLARSPVPPWVELQAFGLYSVGAGLTWLALRYWLVKMDAKLVAAVYFLMGMGLAIQFRMGVFTDGAGVGMLIALPLGMVGLLAAAGLAGGGRYEALSRCGGLGYFLAVAGMAAMLVFGRRYRGGVYMPGNVNPSEIVKPLLVVFLAAFLSRRTADFGASRAGIPWPRARSLWPLALLWAVPAGLVLLLRDLGLLLLLNAVLVIMLYAVGRKVGYLVCGAAGVALSGLAASALSPHVKARFDVWLRPFADATGKGWQVLQGLSGMYAGGLWGAGIGAGRPHSIPIVSSDFVYAALAEELGMLACALLLLIFAWLGLRGWRLSARARVPFGTLLGVGLTALLTVQALLNVGGVTLAIPMTGIPLPFISQGGSSLVTTLMCAGLLAAVAETGRRR